MNYWVIADTHLGHDKMVKQGYRPEGFEQKIFKNIYASIKSEDVLIHLGDVCIGCDEHWNNYLLGETHRCKTWLVKGNHDNKSNCWYLSHGWHCVSDALILDVYGKRILFTHIPCTSHDNFDLNIHGHLHNTNHRNIEGLTEKHKLIYLEHEYRPFSLRKLVEGR